MVKKQIYFLVIVGVTAIIIGCQSFTHEHDIASDQYESHMKVSIPFEIPPRPERKGSYHIVKERDTVYSIARDYNTSAHTIAEYNRLPNPNHLEEGQMLFVPEK